MSIANALHHLKYEFEKAKIKLPVLMFDYDDYCNVLLNQRNNEPTVMIEHHGRDATLCGFPFRFNP